jgi:large subunit ribosomal protein L3
MKIGPMGHGAGYPHRWQGSIAQGRGGSSPQRVIKGKKMAGHYGHEKVTIQNLNVLYKDKEKNLIIIKGAIPGPKNSFVIIKEAIKPHKNKLNFDFNFNEIEKTIDVNHANVENN